MKTIGIIGGMGPLATADLYYKIIAMTDAEKDQDHPHVIIDGNAAIPDRTKAILAGGEDPVPWLIDSAKRLESAGAQLLMMACNTAHYYFDVISGSVDVPFLHMPRETVLEAKRLGYKKIALLATDGTIQSGIYHSAFNGSGIILEVPGEDGQKEVMSLIYSGVKAGARQYDTRRFSDCLSRLQNGGAEAFLLGCTELPLAFELYGLDAPVIDPASVLAKAALIKSGCKIKPEALHS